MWRNHAKVRRFRPGLSHLQLLLSEMMIVTNSMCLQASLSVTRLRLLECLLMQKYPPLHSISHATRPNHCWITAGYQFCIPINCDHRCHCHCHHQWIGLRENFNRKAPYLMGKLWFPVNFPLNQSIDITVLAHLGCQLCCLASWQATG